jgi:hypothetical protein
VTWEDPDEFRRLPGYLRGATGRIVGQCGVWRHPRGHGSAAEPSEPEPVYTVEFSLTDVFGGSCGGGRVYTDLWLRYLRPAPD